MGKVYSLSFSRGRIKAVPRHGGGGGSAHSSIGVDKGEAWSGRRHCWHCWHCEHRGSCGTVVTVVCRAARGASVETFESGPEAYKRGKANKASVRTCLEGGS